MNLTIEFNKSRGYGHVRVVGAFDPSEYEAGVETVLNHADFRCGMPLVFDLREAVLEHLRGETFRTFASVNERLAPRRGNARSAILISGELHFGIMRQYAVLGATPNLENNIFRDLDEAVDWACASSGAGS